MAATGTPLPSLTFVVYMDKRDEWRWKLKSLNGRTIADSGEGYHNRSDCMNAIALIRSEASRIEIRMA